MCGIIAGFNTNIKGKGKKHKEKTEKINKFIIDQYQDQCNRGSKGFGIIRINEKGEIEVDRATEEIKFMLDLYLKSSKMIIAHHRAPTSSDNKMSQTHPISISNKMFEYDYLFVHNGVISNDKKLKEKHEKLGYQYSTEYIKEPYYPSGTPEKKFNDSEALGVEISLFIEKKQEHIETTNQAAFITLQINKKTKKAEKVFFGRNGPASALNLSKTQGNIKISSEGEGEEVVVDTLWSFDPKDPKMKLNSTAMEFKEIKIEESNIGNFEPHSHQIIGTKAIEGTKLTEKIPKTEGGQIITIEQRSWEKDKENQETYDEEEDTFIDKNYEAETLEIFKESIKEDEAEMIETSLDTALDEQVDRIGKIIANFNKTVKIRKIDPKERGFYLSQTYKILITMEKITNFAEDSYNEKIIEEEIKKQEEDESHGTGYIAGRRERRRHNYNTGEYDNMPGVMDFENFG